MKTGVALEGYDPVAYFTDGKPVKGSPEFTASYKAQRTKLPQLSKTVVREIARKIRTAIWRFLWVCCVHRQTGARRGRIFRGPARSIDFAAQQEGLGPLGQRH